MLQMTFEKNLVMFHRNLWKSIRRSFCVTKCPSNDEFPRTKDDLCYDVSIIGGGIIGTAIARDISNKSKNIKMVLIEKENDLGRHQSSHNSGVIHSGVYYEPGSLKAQFSRRGVDLILKYCQDNNIPHKIFGKLIVATNTCKLNDLRTLHDRGVANNVEGLEMLWTKERIKQIEPKCKGIQALWCPKAGNVNWGVITKNFGRDFQENGGQILFNSEVGHIAESDNPNFPILIKTKQNEVFKSKFLIICGGLHSEVLSQLLHPESEKDTALISLRVDYQFSEGHDIGTNIYGVPDLQIPFLGVHITPRLEGGLLLGPNAVPAFKIEGYREDEVNFTYLKDTVTSSGFQNMTRKYFFQCFNQVKKSLCPQFQVDELQTLADLKVEDIQKGPTAVLAQLVNQDGSFVKDFTFDFFSGKGIGKRVIICRFLPSPAATCSLAIAEYVTERFLQNYQSDTMVQ